MRVSSRVALAAVTVGIVLGSAAGVYAAGKRQKYSGWNYDYKKKYYYRKYSYKPTRNYRGYKENQYVIYKPQPKYKQYVYWYNKENKKYWARCPTKYHSKYGQDVKNGKDYWSYPKNNQKYDNIDDVKDEDWTPEQEKSPYLPGNKKGVKIECPPRDEPQEEPGPPPEEE
jgi:hypothetical protein